GASTRVLCHRSSRSTTRSPESNGTRALTPEASALSIQVPGREKRGSYSSAMDIEGDIAGTPVLAGRPVDHHVGEPEDQEEPSRDDEAPQEVGHQTCGAGGGRAGALRSGISSLPFRIPSTTAWWPNTEVAAAIKPSSSARCHGAPAMISALEVPSTPTTSATNGRYLEGRRFASHVENQPCFASATSIPVPIAPARRYAWLRRAAQSPGRAPRAGRWGGWGGWRAKSA